MTKKSNKSFIVELFILFALLIMVITVITVAAVRTRAQSEQAGSMTAAVLCAQNAAEVTAGAGSADEAAGLISKMEGVSSVENEGDEIRYSIVTDSAKEKERTFDVSVCWQEEGGGTGRLVKKTIDVYEEGGKTSVYSLETGKFIKDEQPSEDGEVTQ